VEQATMNVATEEMLVGENSFSASKKCIHDDGDNKSREDLL
jgi:hypothetical protein